MGFTSGKFWLFLITVIILYAAVPKKFRWLVLLAASYTFYALWHWEYIFLLAGLTLVSYFSGRKMASFSEDRQRRLWLWIGLGVTLLSLFFFKYFDYTLAVLQAYIAPGLKVPDFLELAAPIGISFYTLQIFSYLMDVYRRQQPAEQDLAKFALFVGFFPQMVAGPITRAKALLPQLDEFEQLKLDNLTVGLFRILWGGVQKYAIADRLSVIFDQITAGPDLPGSKTALGSLYIFSILLYFDFAGYSNIALGIARLFGIRLAENFNQPYLSLDAADFWNRWHISLSNWLRDYIFYPVMRWLRGYIKNPRNALLIVIPPMAAMLVSGLWHGTGLNFILWGAIHGILLALAAWTSRWRKSMKEKLGRIGGFLFGAAEWFGTFTAITLAWAFFKMPVSTAISYLVGIVTKPGLAVIGIVEYSIIGVLALIFILMELFRAWLKDFDRILSIPLVLRWGVTYLLIFILLLAGDFASSQPFLYQGF
ncbi:MAG: MBOAT family O-acyltransferase [Anaerolineales bacterium]